MQVFNLHELKTQINVTDCTVIPFSDRFCSWKSRLKHNQSYWIATFNTFYTLYTVVQYLTLHYTALSINVSRDKTQENLPECSCQLCLNRYQNSHDEIGTWISAFNVLLPVMSYKLCYTLKLVNYILSIFNKILEL